jgi:hypothetical protein
VDLSSGLEKTQLCLAAIPNTHEKAVWMRQTQKNFSRPLRPDPAGCHNSRCWSEAGRRFGLNLDRNFDFDAGSGGELQHHFIDKIGKFLLCQNRVKFDAAAGSVPIGTC